MKSTRDVIFRAPDLSAVKAYYGDVLGLPPVKTDRESLVGFDSGDLTLYFERGQPNGAVFEFAVDDVQKSKQALLAAGCTLVEENPEIPRVYLSDRFGVTFNITER